MADRLRVSPNSMQTFATKMSRSPRFSTPTGGNLSPLLNGEVLKNYQNCDFLNRMSQTLKKIPLAPPPAAPPGRCRAQGRGYYFKICLKMTHIWLVLFSKWPSG